MDRKHHSTSRRAVIGAMAAAPAIAALAVLPTPAQAQAINTADWDSALAAYRRAIIAQDAQHAAEVEPQGDDCAPHLRTGETAVIDPETGEPTDGDLLLIQWTSGQNRDAIVRLWRTPTIIGKDREPVTEPHWMIGGTRAKAVRTLAGGALMDHRTGKPMGPIQWVDGPYDRAYLDRLTRGRVIGLLASSYDEPKRLGSAVQ